MTEQDSFTTIADGDGLEDGYFNGILAATSLLQNGYVVTHAGGSSYSMPEDLNRTNIIIISCLSNNSDNTGSFKINDGSSDVVDDSLSTGSDGHARTYFYVTVISNHTSAKTYTPTLALTGASAMWLVLESAK